MIQMSQTILERLHCMEHAGENIRVHVHASVAQLVRASPGELMVVGSSPT